MSRSPVEKDAWCVPPGITDYIMACNVLYFAPFMQFADTGEPADPYTDEEREWARRVVAKHERAERKMAGRWRREKEFLEAAFKRYPWAERIYDMGFEDGRGY